MSAGYQVNIVINSGVSFYQEFYLTNPDLTPRDITGCKFAANLSKHPRSIDVEVSTSEKPKYNYHKFQTKVVNGVGGVFCLTMPAHQTQKLKEGKYVFNVILREKNGFTSSVLDGLVFVDTAFGDVQFTDPDACCNDIISDGGGAVSNADCILDGGSALNK